jgi:hypothetical protein
VLVSQKVAAGIYCGVTTTELDELAAETAAAMTSTHPDYALVSFCSWSCVLWSRKVPRAPRARASPTPRARAPYPAFGPRLQK